MLTQTLLVFGGVICLLAFEIMNLIASGARGEGAIKLEIIGGLIALALLWYGIKIVRDMIRFARRKREIEPIFIMGQIVSPEQAPQLWQFVREVAWQAKAKLPDSTVVGLNEGFFVTEHPVALANGQRVPDGRVLYLPLPYMAFLGRTEVAAVVAHELGHFTGEDTAYGRRFAPIYRALVDGILAITNEHDAEDDGWRAWVTGPATLYGKWFLQNFDEAVHYWSRERELAADEFSRRVAGTDATALALLRTAVLHDLVEEALLHNRTAPPEKREGVLTMVRRFVAERGLTDPQNHLEDRQAHPLDSHPSLKQRLDALGVTITPTLVARTRDVSDAQLLAELGLEAAPPA
ncbi:MAG: M48 family metallopeptidase [Methylobacillus sp.]|jgi:Zn-dependent protease with chaperone function|nr:M48 family metallopeptidase [Methylobacillus sp.]